MQGIPENGSGADVIIYFYQCNSFSHSFNICSTFIRHIWVPYDTQVLPGAEVV
jgi:hypothetical protein